MRSVPGVRKRQELHGGQLLIERVPSTGKLVITRPVDVNAFIPGSRWCSFQILLVHLRRFCSRLPQFIRRKEL